MARAYYNEIDSYAAEWIRNLIKAGHITDGEVDTRSIVDVRPEDLRGFDRCHFFAGIAVWDYALGLAGWPEDRAVWTGSCPCQPFSAAGKRGGTADERHLWPAFFHLIRECRPATVLGEQVASKDGLGWLDLVHADLEGEGYAVGVADLCAAGVGAPHIRQRLWFVADASGERRGGLGLQLQSGSARQAVSEAGRGGEARLVADTASSRHSGREDAGADRGHPRALQGGGQRLAGVLQPQRGCADGSLADVLGSGLEGRDARALGDECASVERGGSLSLVGYSGRQGSRRNAGAVPSAQGEGAGERGGVGREPDEPVASGAARGLADADGRHPGAEGLQRGGEQRQQPQDGLPGFWSDVEWLPCRDGKARPTQPGLFPLVDGSAFSLGSGSALEGKSRQGMLRAYGNAIVAPVAATFIASVLDVGAL